MNDSEKKQNCLCCKKIYSIHIMKTIVYNLCICMECIDKQLKITTNIFQLTCIKCTKMKEYIKIGAPSIIGALDKPELFICKDCK